jgi:glycosyltransferase involved in cell wall biosynthesis
VKLVIQIPCLNEEATLPGTMADLPRSVPGIDSIEVQVIDDGSTDRTVEVARRLGVRHVVQLGTHRGLATAFSVGIRNALALGADVVVNTDGDNQYCGADIPRLVAPILAGRADVVVGSRPIVAHEEFGLAKKALQLAGSWLLRLISRTSVRDAASGFRAFSRHACSRLFVHSRFSHCMETLIQAGNSGLRVESVDVRVNGRTRESRLFRSVPAYVARQAATMVAMALLYRPFAFFGALAAPCFLAATLLGLRYLYLKFHVYPADPGRTFVPSLILVAVLAVLGTGLLLAGLVSSLFVAQRRLIEAVLTNQIEERWGRGAPERRAGSGLANTERTGGRGLGAQ